MFRVCPALLLLLMPGCVVEENPSPLPHGESWTEPLSETFADREGPRFQVLDVGVDVPLTLAQDPADRWLDDFAGGAAALDCDGDGDADLYVTTGVGPNRLYRNDGGLFTDLNDASVGYPELLSTGASTADYDDDGDPDLFLTVQFDDNRLLRNDGDCQFTDVTGAAGITSPWRSLHSYWIDIERDGDLDLYIANWADPLPEGSDGRPDAHPDQLWVNVGDGTFEERSELLPAATRESFAMTGAFLDFDNDGDYDLFQVNDRGAFIVPNRLYRNDAEAGELPVFIDVSEQQGFDAAPDGMGLTVGDYNLDGRADFFTTGNFESLFVRQGSRYVDSALAMGFPFEGGLHLSWGGITADFDADGDEDLFFVDSLFFDSGFGDLAPYRGDASHFRNDLRSDFRFVDRPLEGLLSTPQHWRANAGTDFDGDGIPDLYLGTVERPPVLAFTNPPRIAEVVEVRLHGTTSNSEGRGAVVRGIAGDVEMTRWPGASDSWSCGTPTWTHFGLARATQLDRVVIEWPSGTVQEILDVPSGVRLHVVEPAE